MSQSDAERIADALAYIEIIKQCKDYRLERDCPACDLKNAFDEGGCWEICQRCAWEDDPTGRDDENLGYGPNGGWSLKQYRELISTEGLVRARRIQCKRDPDLPCPEIDDYYHD